MRRFKSSHENQRLDFDFRPLVIFYSIQLILYRFKWNSKYRINDWYYELTYDISRRYVIKTYINARNKAWHRTVLLNRGSESLQIYSIKSLLDWNSRLKTNNGTIDKFRYMNSNASVICSAILTYKWDSICFMTAVK